MNHDVSGRTRAQTLTPTYAPLVSACQAHGISRSVAFQLARAGLISTFKIGNRTFVTLDSLARLPERMRETHQ